jgi:hypothetical protein
MATIGVGTNSHMRPRDMSKVQIKYYPEAASQSFKAGHLVILSSGKVTKAASDPAANTILGIAAQAATGTTDSPIGVYVADVTSEYIAHVEASAVTAVTDIGVGYGIVLDGTYDVFRVDKSDTTNKKVVITEILDAVGDTNGRVVFHFQAAALLPGVLAI